VLASHNTHNPRMPDTKQFNDKAGGTITKRKGKGHPRTGYEGQEGK